MILIVLCVGFLTALLHGFTGSCNILTDVNFLSASIFLMYYSQNLPHKNITSSCYSSKNHWITSICMMCIIKNEGMILLKKTQHTHILPHLVQTNILHARFSPKSSSPLLSCPSLITCTFTSGSYQSYSPLDISGTFFPNCYDAHSYFELNLKVTVNIINKILSLPSLGLCNRFFFATEKIHQHQQLILYFM